MKILVVGGSGGIGAATVRLLRAEGHMVFFTYCAHETKAATLEKSTGAKKLHFDFFSDDSISQLVDFIGKEFLDGLVYTAAQKPGRETLLKMSAGTFLDYVAHSLRGYYRASQAFAASVKGRKSGGSLVNVLSSVVSGLPPAKQAGYVSAKYALLGLTRCQAVEFGAFGVRVNSVSPGMTKTDFNSDLPQRFLEIYAESLPMKRLLSPEEVAEKICFLFSDKASDLRGTDILMGGGSPC